MNATAHAESAHLETKEAASLERQRLEDAVFNAVQGINWTELQGWGVFSQIADRADPDSMLVYTESMSVRGRRITAAADLTVVLHYDARDEDDAEEFTDNFPASLVFERDDDGRVRFTSLSVDIERD